ncbi:MAG: tyrosine-type recombinase/integrase [Rhodothermales bacterium]|nr:tyrosine-type recombinase/integrase [Rhodothermales bacterium]
MAKATPVLAKWKKNKRGHSPVFIRIADREKTRYVSTGVRITERQWNEKKGEVRASAKNADLHNATIRTMLATADQHKVRMKLEGAAVTTDDLKRALSHKAPPRPQDPPLIFDEYRQFMKSKRARFRASTLEVYKALESHLQDWLTPRARVSDITPGFLTDLQDHLIGEGLANVTTNKLTSRAKGFCRWLVEHDLLTKVPPVKPLKTARGHVVRLTLEELEAVRDVDLSDLPAGYRAARDLFLMAAYTGQRISDISRMEWKDIRSGVWYVVEGKTGVVRQVPLPEPAREIVEGRGEEDRPVPRLSDQRCNNYLKVIGERAGLTALVTVRYQRGGDIETKVVPKHEVLTTHVGRKSFISLMLEAGLSTKDLLGLTHSDLRSLRSYAAASEQHVRDKMRIVFSGTKGGTGIG